MSGKVRENRVRRVAERRGLRLEKSRRRDPHAPDFGLYMLFDARTNLLSLPSTQNGNPWSTLDRIEEFLKNGGKGKFPPGD